MPDRFGAALSNDERPGVVLTVTAGGGPANDASPLTEPGPASYAAMVMCPPPIRLTDDMWCFLPRLGSDAWGVVNNINNLAILGVGVAGTIAIRDNWDSPVRNWTAEFPDRWGEGSKVIGNFGVAQYQIPVILAAYGYTVWAQDVQDHEMMMSLISAYALTGLSTTVIKGVTNTRRPTAQWNGGEYGFPSYHTASLFAISAVLDDYEGHWIGVPMYIFSGLVGWSRIDTRDHDLSDVVFGAILGYVIGQSVAGKALYGDSRVHIFPYIQPTDGSAGLMMDMSF
jgi:membrane-associated phospholipid phosphatase